MTSSAAIPILQALADGLDPATDEAFPPDSPYQRADTIRAIYTRHKHDPLVKWKDRIKKGVGIPRPSAVVTDMWTNRPE